MNQREAVEMLKVTIVRNDKRQAPLPSCGDPSISDHDWTACETARGDDAGPDHTGIFIGNSVVLR